MEQDVWVLLSSTVAQDTVNGSIEDLGIVANAGTITAAWSELSAGNLRQLYVAELSEVAELPATLVSLAVTPSNPSLAAGVSQQFTATGTYSNSSTQNLTGSVTWSSSATGVATINASGSATGVARGTTTVTAASGSVSGLDRSDGDGAGAEVSTLACAPASLGQSAVSTCTVTLTQTRSRGRIRPTLASNNALLTVPASVTVAVGARDRDLQCDGIGQHRQQSELYRDRHSRQQFANSHPSVCWRRCWSRPRPALPPVSGRAPSAPVR